MYCSLGRCHFCHPCIWAFVEPSTCFPTCSLPLQFLPSTCWFAMPFQAPLTSFFMVASVEPESTQLAEAALVPYQSFIPSILINFSFRCVLPIHAGTPPLWPRWAEELAMWWSRLSCAPVTLEKHHRWCPLDCRCEFCGSSYMQGGTHGASHKCVWALHKCVVGAVSVFFCRSSYCFQEGIYSASHRGAGIGSVCIIVGGTHGASHECTEAASVCLSKWKKTQCIKKM